jgi:glyoxylase-like metal-dependent hydrolase (beta-lactamase superfamily II)
MQLETEVLRFQVGAFSCVAIQDNVARYPLSMFIHNLPKERYQPWLRERGLDLEFVDTPYTCLFVDTGREKVLVDTGIGRDGFTPRPGQVSELLRTIGVGPDAIDTVILTHMHSDHSGGCLTAEDRPAFPNATYRMSREEFDYWTSNPSLDELPLGMNMRQVLLASASRNISGIRNQLDLLNGEVEVHPGITAIPAFGHTPGHVVVEIRSAGEKLLFASDAFIHPIHIEYPEACAVFDHHPEQMSRTRVELLERAAREKLLLAAYHFPFPGLGFIERKEGAWCWSPLPVPVSL